MEWLGAVRQQAITWSNVDPDLCPHMTSPGHNELNPMMAMNFVPHGIAKLGNNYPYVLTALNHGSMEVLLRNRISINLLETVKCFDMDRMSKLHQFSLGFSSMQVPKKELILLTHYPLGDVAEILNKHFLNSYERQIFWVFTVKFPSGECHKILLMIRQYWFR